MRGQEVVAVVLKLVIFAIIGVCLLLAGIVGLVWIYAALRLVGGP